MAWKYLSDQRPHKSKHLAVQNANIPLATITMSSLLSALGNPKVNYFSLDIEGAELQVLQSLPWHLVDIEVRRRTKCPNSGTKTFS